MHVRTMRPSGPHELPQKRRKIPWARLILILAIAGVLGYIFVPRYLSIGADGVVMGQLVPVAPLFSARIDSIAVQCGQSVTKGQPVAIVTNFLLQGQYEQDNQRMSADLVTQQIAQSQGLTEALAAEASALERYQSAVYETRKLETIKDAYEHTFEAGAIGRLPYEEAAADWRAAVAEQQSLQSLWEQAHDRVARVKSEDGNLEKSYANQVAVSDDLKNQVHAQALFAPVSGRIVQCDGEPQAIIEAGTAIYKIFSPKRAYVLAYFDPPATARVHVGDKVAVSIVGFPTRIEGRVVVIYPTLSRLPDQLTRFFWQHQQWSEYRPIKISIPTMDNNLTDQLAYDAQVHVEIQQHMLPWQSRTVETETALR
jgi:multidrug resistance efflux pump